MSKNYRMISRLVSRTKDDLYRAYDKGYQQAKEDYSRRGLGWLKINDGLPDSMEWVLVCERLDEKPRLAFIDKDGKWHTDVGESEPPFESWFKVRFWRDI